MTQATALQILKTGTNVFLTGEPGSGKSYLVNQYIRYLRDHGLSVAITASTGIAATHISGVTLQSWAGTSIKKKLTEHELHVLSGNARLVKRVKAAHVLIIDEISMLDAAVFDLVDLVCRAVRGKPEPFGGLQVVAVGDFYQLPPIERHGEDPAQFVFTGTAWPEAMFAVCYLTEQHRQSDTALSNVLAAIRTGSMTDEVRAHLTARRVAHHDEAAVPTKLFTHNKSVDEINATKLATLPGPTKTFVMTSQGQKVKIEQLIHGCLSPATLELKVGAVVMCTRNNPELGFVNGTLATVIDFDKESGHPIIKTHQGRRITVPPADWVMEEGDRRAAVIIQIPLRLAWAMSVHKSQGMSLDAAVMDLSRSFAYGQGYVALSRVRTLAGLHLLGWNEQALKTDPDIQTQDAVMREQSLAVAAAWQAKSETDQTKQQETFIRSNGGKKQAVATQTESKTEEDRLTRIRKQYPQAYAPWTDEEDATVADMFRGEVTIKRISDKLARQPGAIRSRIKHLGLTD